MFYNQDLGQFVNAETALEHTMNQNGSGDCHENVNDKTKLIVNYIPQFTTEEDLAVVFTQVGPVENIRIMRNFRTGYSFGYGFVKYYKEEDAAKAIDVLNGLNYRNKRLKVSYSRPPGHAMKDSNLYISNLPKDLTEKDLDKLFGQFGEIVQRNVLKDKISGLSRGVAFVRFSKGEEARAAIASLDGKQLENGLLPISVRVAEDHSRQRAQIIVAHPNLACRGFSYRNSSSLPIGRTNCGMPNQRNRSFLNGTNRFMGGGDSHQCLASMFW